MTPQELLSWGTTLSLAVALAASAGLRAWLPLLAVGLLARAEVLQLGEGFAFLAGTPMLALFGVATVLEVGADKVPALDHALDVASTFIRPLAGALLAAGVIWQIRDPIWATVLGLVVGAPIAAAPHVAKSALRVASTATTGGLANPIVSMLEDLGALTLVALAVLLPIVTLALLVVGGVIVARTIARRRGRAGAASPTA